MVYLILYHIDYTLYTVVLTLRTADLRRVATTRVRVPRVERSFQACELGDVYKNYSVRPDQKIHDAERRMARRAGGTVSSTVSSIHTARDYVGNRSKGEPVLALVFACSCEACGSFGLRASHHDYASTMSTEPLPLVAAAADQLGTTHAQMQHALMLVKYNKMHVNAHGCTRMHKNAYGKKQHHFWEKTTLHPRASCHPTPRSKRNMRR